MEVSVAFSATQQGNGLWLPYQAAPTLLVESHAFGFENSKRSILTFGSDPYSPIFFSPQQFSVSFCWLPCINFFTEFLVNA
jgi:hypothetical protein